ncbi:hypothetical protein OAK48_00775 [Deltaproteobacteria bacterium]|nr:hypothetical protein [Deltaproteobacteria bacterium]
MLLIIRSGSFVNADQDFTADFFCEDVVIHINSPFNAPYYRAIQKLSAATTPFAVER